VSGIPEFRARLAGILAAIPSHEISSVTGDATTQWADGQAMPLAGEIVLGPSAMSE
jgi:hypothetical protein